VLLASGYIAGGAIAGIVIAIVTAGFVQVDAALTNWAEAHNPFYSGAHSDWLALLPFAALTGFLFLVGRAVLLGGSTPPRRTLPP
jgi:hypothetical protein